MNRINTQNFIIEWESMKGTQNEFDSLYDYALYTCGGDFSQFDNIGLLEEEINK